MVKIEVIQVGIKVKVVVTNYIQVVQANLKEVNFKKVILLPLVWVILVVLGPQGLL